MRSRLAVLEHREIGSPVTVSVGVAVEIPGRARGMDALLAAADTALYRAKDAGKNRVEIDQAPAHADTV